MIGCPRLTASRPPQPRRLTTLHPEHFEDALQAAIAAYPAGNDSGVFGVSVRRRTSKGRRHRQRTVALFVSRKQFAPSVAVAPLRFRSGNGWFEVVPDVVATGREAVAGAGSAPSFTGLHAGAAMRVDFGLHCVGGVACLLAEHSEPSHLLTAGHLFPSGSGLVPVLASRSPLDPPEAIGVLETNFLEAQVSFMDVALVRLNAAGTQMALQSGMAPSLPRLESQPFPSGLVQNTWLRVFLPLTGDYVSDLSGELPHNQFNVQSGCRGAHVVRNVIETAFSHNTEGNSGTILLSDDRSGGVRGQGVGIAVAFAGGTSLYEPLDRAISLSTSAVGRPLRVWSQA